MTEAFSAKSDAVARQIVDLISRGSLAEAEALAARARRQFPAAAELARLHGVALLRLQRPIDALIALEQAAEIDPQNIEVQCNLASLQLTNGDADGAIERLRAALRMAPGHSAVLLGLGNALMAAARYTEARESYALATYGAQGHPGLRLNLAAAELQIGRAEQAQVHIAEALQIHPRFDAAYALLGQVLSRLGQPAQAAEAWLQAERLAPRNAQYPLEAGQLLEETGMLAAAAEAYARAVQLLPDNGPALSQLVFVQRKRCDWRELDSLSQSLLRLVEADVVVSPFVMLSEDVSATVQERAATTYAAMIERESAALRKRLDLVHAKAAPNSPIQVGFVADGFNEHATGLLIVALIEALADDGMQLHLFATTADDGGPIRRRLAQAATLHDVSALDHEQTARRIHETSIEILFDLNGYSGRNTAKLMALRAAPLQVNWLAYPGTSGAAWMDYLLADKIVVPDVERVHVSEKLLRLPRCYQPSDITRTIPAPPSRAECGLPETGIVFACFNNNYKLNQAAFARLMLIAHQVPDSVLWLLSGPEGADDRLRAAATAAGIAPERLIFLPRLPHADYLARYAHVDLFLDTLPYGAHTTASDALWAGCPLLTCSGTTFAGRVASSLLTQAGLPELITEDEESFIAMATSLGKQPEALRTLRRHLAQQRASNPLFDMRGFAADFSRTVQTISARHRIGRPAADIDI